jgi:hypothetical protein
MGSPTLAAITNLSSSFEFKYINVVIAVIPISRNAVIAVVKTTLNPKNYSDNALCS